MSGSPIGNLHAVTLLAAAAGASASADGPTCYSRLTNEWICRQYVEDFRPEIQHATIEHLQITALSVLLGLAIAFPLALLARRFARLESTTVGVATAIYTIPSLALLPLMVPFTGLSKTTVVIALGALRADDPGPLDAGGAALGTGRGRRVGSRARATAPDGCCSASSCRWRPR